MTKKVRGCVDSIRDQSIAGWVLIDGEDDLAKVEVFLNGNCIGAASATIARQDLKANCGFAIVLDDPVDPMDIVSQQLVVKAGDTALPFYKPMLDQIILRTVLKNATMDAALKAIVQELSLKSKITTPPPPVNDLSQFSLPVGFVSYDGSVAVGRNGHLFLIAGSNSLSELYADTRSEAELNGHAHSWFSVVSERQRVLSKAGIPFRQIILPEKSSVLVAEFPQSLSVPTPIYRSVATRLSELESFLPLFEKMKSVSYPSSLYLKTDTHLTSAGAQLVFNEILDSFGIERVHVPLTAPIALSGDLANRFPSAPMFSADNFPDPDMRERLDSTVEILDERHVPGHVGMSMITRNDAAPIAKTVVVFGNSFFGMGNKPPDLGWWMSRFFKEYHFRWSPEFDFDYVDKVKPDFVIGQTIERFLTRSPPQ